MASIPMEQVEETRRGARPPISAHPAFPAIVALWFAALLGLGSLILPVQLIERLVTATGISSVISAAAPPLGFTARAAIALVATILGALLGVVAARRVAGASVSTPQKALRKGKQPRFLNAAEDLGEEGIAPELDDDALEDEFDASEAPAKRRRPLAMAEDEGPSILLETVPLPGADMAEDDEADLLELDEEIELTGEFDPDIEPEHVEEPAPVVISPAPRQEFIVPDGNDEEAPGAVESDEDGEEVTTEPFRFEDRSRKRDGALEPLAFSPPSMARVSPDDSQGDARPFDAPPANSKAEDAEVSADETAEPAETVAADTADKQMFTPHVPEEPALPSTDSQDQDTPMDFTPETPAATEDENDVGLVQLVQKLGSTLEKHREWSAQRAAEKAAMPQEEPAETARAIPQEFEAARPDDAAEAMAAYFGKPAASPEAEDVAIESEQHEEVEARAFDAPAPLHAVSGQGYAPFSESVKIDAAYLANAMIDDEEEEDEIADLAASFSLPIQQERTEPAPQPTPRPSFDIPPASAKASAEVSEEEDEVEEPAATPARDADYDALSAVDNPFKRSSNDFVRIEEPEADDDSAQPAVVFPNEQARRAAPEAHEEAPVASAPRAFDPPAAGGREPASNDDNERALREALMNLQRMGK